eukprot:TRINITY_DN10289_c0_g1_i2.p1 TRINITY_DN10289_c0_g1~~TRINITY_DN10289_c0_g1_i2.p1  ORF type:complete len:430 (+),score=145.42 TRINITY_DN10289_c0_g1_i2:126-1292(+)
MPAVPDLELASGPYTPEKPRAKPNLPPLQSVEEVILFPGDDEYSCSGSEPDSPDAVVSAFHTTLQSQTTGSCYSFDCRGSFSDGSSTVRETPLRQLGEDDVGYTTVNQYCVLDCIGMGAFSKVYLAIDGETETLCAMKILKKGPLRRKGLLEKVQAEVALYKKIDHSHVVKLLEVIDDEEEDNIYMVFEYLSEGVLLALTADGGAAEGPFTEAEARRAMRDVVSGLSFLHDNGVHHCDVKPDNLLVTDAQRVKIADLGSAVTLDPEDPDATVELITGTPAFLPPEVVEGVPGRRFDPRAVDVWALGVTMYALVTGHLPFHGESLKETNAAILHAPIRTPAELDGTHAAALIRSMLIKDPASRITLEEVKLHPFFDAAAAAQPPHAMAP